MCEQHPKSEEGSEMEVTTIGIDLAKSVFAVSGADSRGRVVIRRQRRRTQVLGFMRGLPRCVVGMEATGGAQYWARQFTALGHAVRLMSPALVMPYRKGNKTVRNDAVTARAARRRSHSLRRVQRPGPGHRMKQSPKPPPTRVSEWGVTGGSIGKRRLLTRAQFAELRRKLADGWTKSRAS
jgi:transposase